jgi:hypothetical protein
MSVSIGSKPIVTSGLTHLYDQLSPKSMPSGSEVWYNHLPSSYAEKNAKYSPSGTKAGLATYGSKTEHARLKGYDTYDGSGDYWNFTDNNVNQQPIQQFPMTFIIWARHTKADTSTRALGGFTGNNASYYYGYFQVYYTGSKLKPYWKFEPQTSFANVAMDVDLDNQWHMWCVRETSGAVRDFTLDAGDFGSVTSTYNVSTPWEFNASCDNFDIGNAQTGDSYDNSWLGDIGPWYIFNRSISDSEVRQMYDANKDRFNL